MFERIKKAFSKDADSVAEPSATSSRLSASGPVSEWAGSRGLVFTPQGAGERFLVEGKIGSKPWKIEVGKPSRNYIRDHELRARAELGTGDDVAVLVMNRPLKETLEKKAYSIYTDGLQTIADPSLPEEMRWLAMYEEVAWESPPAHFWNRYSVLANRPQHAAAWIDDALAGQLLDWPGPQHSAETPLVVMLLRGKAYLRMQYHPGDMLTLRHAADVFTYACESAVARLTTDVPV